MEMLVMDSVTLGHHNGVDPGLLARALASAGVFASNDPVRGAIHGVHVSFDGDDVRIMATDSYRLIDIRIGFDRDAMTDIPSGVLLVDSRCVRDIVRVIGKGKNQAVAVRFAPVGDVLSVTTETGSVNVRLVGGTFPNIDGLFRVPGWPTFGQTVRFDSELLAGAVDSIGSVLGGKGVRPIDIVSMAESRAIELRATGDGVSVRGLVMPYRGGVR